MRHRLREFFILIAMALAFWMVGCEGNEFSMDDHYVQTKSLITNKIQVSDEVLDYLNNDIQWDSPITIALVFDETINIERASVNLKVVKNDRNEEISFLNGKQMNEQDKIWLNNNIIHEREQAIKANRDLRKDIIAEIKTLGVEIDKATQQEFIDGYDALIIEANKSIIDKFINHSKLIGIELYQPSKSETISSAMSATYVTQSASYTYNRNGQGVGIYVGDAGCPVSSYLNNYQRLETSDVDSDHARKVTAILRYVSPNATIYCRGNFSLPQASDIGTSSHNPPIFIANLSFGHVSSTYDYSDKAVDDLSYNQGITIVKSAGNDASYVTSPGHGLNIITVGNYNDHNDTPSLYAISTTSSYLRATDTNNVKPEISAPGTNISLPGYRNIQGNALSSCTGTSCAAPHVAGMLANRNSYWTTPNYASFTPALAKSFALQGATDNVSGGLEKVGYGGIDFYNMSHVYAYWWIKGNYGNIDSNDEIPNNGIIDDYLTLSATSNRARIAFVWMNRGSWVYAHRNAVVSMGTEFRFKVYDPNGNLLSSAWNRVNGFMFLDFDVNVSGQYHFQVERVANYDEAASLNMAVTVFK